MNNSPIGSQTLGAAPIAKVANPAYTQAMVAISVWALQTYAHTEIPPEVAVAAALLLSGFVAYMTPLRAHEVR